MIKTKRAAGLTPAVLVLLLCTCSPMQAGEKADLSSLISKEIIGPRQAMIDLQKYLATRIPSLPQFESSVAWEKYAAKVREDVLQKVVFRGEAAAWRKSKYKVEWLATLPGGPGYRLKQVRFEAVPGLWIPALLYEPEKLEGKVPATLNVMGHDPGGKDVDYQQIRCINLAKRGMLALNVEWFYFGQLKAANYHHGRMNQLDLCGTSGLAPFYLALERGLDVLLSHPNADPKRVAVSGLSGGGWQTIYISALDTRVTLSNPVAGYSSFRSRAKHFKDLGDSEQTPCDMATVADYAHLTALMAPRATLLTYNAKDQCCFESGYALPPLMEAAGPVFQLFGKRDALRSHVNHDPGTHNFEIDNRQAFYKMIGAHFFPNDLSYSAVEVSCKDEIKNRKEVEVPLPSPNADFNSLAVALAKQLPRDGELPKERKAALAWQNDRLGRLHQVVQYKDFAVKAERIGGDEKDGVNVSYWRLHLGDYFVVPVVELAKGNPRDTALVVHDDGRAKSSAVALKLLSDGQRVLLVDPFYFGESKMAERAYLFALFVSTVGDRPLGLQASQVAAVARWAKQQYQAPVLLHAQGPRTSLIALVAAALEEAAISDVELNGSYSSLKEVLERNPTFDQMPEMFCFGLLEHFDIKQLAALVAPRLVRFVPANERQKSDLAELAEWYRIVAGPANRRGKVANTPKRI